MARKTGFWHSQTFRFWVACYLIVMLIPLAFTGLQQSRLSTSLREEARAQSQSAVEQLGITVDEQLKTIFSVSDAICSSSEIRKLRYISLPFDAAKYYDVHQRAKSLSDYLSHSSLISGMYVYSRNLECLLDAGHISTESNQLYSIMKKNLGLDPEVFHDLMSVRHLHDLYMADGGRKLLMLQTVSTGLLVQQPPLTLIMVINTNDMEKTARHISHAWDGTARILLPDEALLPCATEVGPSGVLDTVSRFGALAQENMIIASSASAVSPISYVLSIPSSFYYQEVMSGWLLFGYFFACTLLLSLVLAYFLARHNYLPVQRLKETADIASRSSNEFALITQRLRELKTDHDQLQEEIHRLELIENERLYDALLAGKVDQLDSPAAVALRSDFSGKQHIAMLFEPDRDESSAADRAGLVELLRSGLDRACAGVAQSYVRESGSEIVGILCFPGKTDPYDAQLYAKQVMKALIVDNPLQSVSVYIGDTHPDCIGVSLSYQESVRAREYTRFVSEIEKQVVVYDKTMYSSNVSWEHFDIVDAERRFISLLLKGNYDACESLFGEIMTYYTGHEGVSLYVLRCRMYSIMNMLLNVLREIEPNVNADLYENGQLVQQLMTVRTMQELEDAVSHILSQLRQQHEAEPLQRGQRLDKVEQYIIAHYHDPLLSVQQVADHFEMSLPYLSREFKNSRGMGVLTYINRYRITKAKELLLHSPQMTVAEVAEAVGYNSSQTLIRIFKRYESITPGQYRAELVRDEVSEEE